MKTKRINCIWFAPLITLALLLVLYALSQIFPFGSNSSAFSDGIGQYIPMLLEMKHKILNGGSLLFTWHTGRGSNFLSIISYYLASPLNLIALLFKDGDIDNAFSIITLLKPVLAALTFGIYLKHTYKKNDVSIVIFSVLWAMSGFFIGSFFFISWIDSIIYFPLVVLFLKRLMDGGSGVPYALFLGLTIISNFYIGWIVCIFCIIYFIYTFIADEEVVYEGVTAPNGDDSENNADEESINIFAVFKNSYLLSSIFRFIFFSVLAGAISAILTLSTLFALQSTLKGVTHSHSTFVENDIWGLLASHILPIKHTYSSITSLDCLFCFVGIMSVILVTAYFFSKGISVRKKVANAFLLVVFWASMVIYPIYFAWHGFGEPAGIMYRFAFLYSFVLLKIAFEAFCEIKSIPIYGFLAGLFVCGIDIFAIKKNEIFNAYFSGAEYIVPVIVFAVLFAVILILISKKVKAQKVLSFILLFAVVLEIGVLNRNNLNYKDLTGILAEQDVVNSISKDYEKGSFVAFEKNDNSFHDIVAYGFLSNFNDNTVYSSLANGDFTIDNMYFGCNGNGMNSVDSAKEQTPIYNLYFPTKYYVDGTGRLTENQFRKEIKSESGYTLFENNFTMPFMYTVSKQIDNWDPFAFFSPIDEQIEAFKDITGTDKNVITYNEMTNKQMENCTYISNADRMEEMDRDDGNKGYYEFLEEKMLNLSVRITDLTKPAYYSFDSVAENDGIGYFFVNIAQFSDLTITVNGKTREYYTFGVGENRTYEIGEVKKGDVIRIKLGGYRTEPNEKGEVYATPYETFSAVAYTVDMDVFEEGYKKLDAMSDTELLEFEDTYVKAKVESFEDGLLYIPTAYDKGWTITIDGNEVPLYEHESHILMTEISKGEHIVEMKYCPQGFTAGAVITGVSLLILIAWAVISKKRNDKMAVSENANENVSEE